MSEKKIPEVRFRGFRGEWETLKLSDIAEFNPKAEIPNNFEYVDLESVVGTQLIGSRKENKKTAPSRAQRVAVQGDVFYQTVRPYQKNNYMFDMPYTNYVFSTGYAQLRPYGDSYCLLSFLQNSKFIKKVLDDCTGTSYPAINSTVLSVINVKYSDDADEQTKIGEFFKNLDDLIAQNQKKYDKLVNMKKACLDKMFPKEGADTPEVRFQGFGGEWEKKELGTLYKKIRNAFVGTATPFYVENGNFYLESNNVKNGQINRNNQVFINDEFYLKQKDNWLHTGDLVVVQSGHVGHCAVIPPELDNTAAHALIIISIPTGNTVPHFVNYQFLNSSTKNNIANITTGNTIKHILSSGMKTFNIYVTDMQEQTKIGTFFQTLDNLITLRKTELEKLKNIKKACLDKMFI